MDDLPDNGEPELDDENEEDAIVVRDKDGIVVQMEEAFDVTKLSDGAKN